MKRWTVLLSAMTVLVVACGSAYAGDINGRIGITGNVGFSAGSKSEYTRQFMTANSLSSDELEPDIGFVGGGGVIFGLTRTLALEAGALYLGKTDFKNSGVKALEISALDVSLGLQLRNNASENLTAYLGAGADVLLPEVEDANGNEGDADTVVGGHVNAGGDYFVSKSVAINLDLRGLFFPDADLKSGGVTVAKYNPITFVALFGVRFFLN